jgi:hypothetical protein
MRKNYSTILEKKAKKVKEGRRKEERVMVVVSSVSIICSIFFKLRRLKSFPIPFYVQIFRLSHTVFERKVKRNLEH